MLCWNYVSAYEFQTSNRVIDDGHYGYHGYKWKDKLKQAELLVWTFLDVARDSIEAIEAELVYYIREKTGSWPKYQMEIHFHEASKSEMHIARSILGICLNKEFRGE